MRSCLLRFVTPAYLLFFLGCAPYYTHSTYRSFSTTKLNKNTYKVHLEHKLSSPSKAFDIVILKTARFVLSKEKRYFLIRSEKNVLSKKEIDQHRTYLNLFFYPYNFYPYISSRSTLGSISFDIVLLTSPPEDSTNNTIYDAKIIIKNLKKKYRKEKN